MFFLPQNMLWEEKENGFRKIVSNNFLFQGK